MPCFGEASLSPARSQNVESRSASAQFRLALTPYQKRLFFSDFFHGRFDEGEKLQTFRSDISLASTQPIATNAETVSEEQRQKRTENCPTYGWSDEAKNFFSYFTHFLSGALGTPIALLWIRIGLTRKRYATAG